MFACSSAVSDEGGEHILDRVKTVAGLIHGAGKFFEDESVHSEVDASALIETQSARIEMVRSVTPCFCQTTD